MTRGFIKYFLILFVFFFSATGLGSAFVQKPGSNNPSAESIKVPVHSGLRSFEQVRTVFTRLPLAGSERRSDRFVADENEVEEDHLSKKGVTRYTSLASAFAFVFLPSATIHSGVFAPFKDYPGSLSNKVYLLLRVFRI